MLAHTSIGAKADWRVRRKSKIDEDSSSNNNQKHTLSMRRRAYGKPSEDRMARYTVEYQLPNFLRSAPVPEGSRGTRV